jgi:hypothetical protein
MPMPGTIRVDRRNRVAMIEPGVTFEELIPAVEKEGLATFMPLLPRSRKSVAFIETLWVVAANAQYDAERIGVYVQPTVQGTNCHVEFTFSYASQAPTRRTRPDVWWKRAARCWPPRARSSRDLTAHGLGSRTSGRMRRW